MLYLGIDIIEFSQIERPLLKYGQRFKKIVYTENEIAICESCSNNISAYAERFALKEASMKAFGTGAAEGIYWNQIEYLNDDDKILNFFGNSKFFIDNNKIKNISFSVSSTKYFSVAIVTME